MQRQEMLPLPLTYSQVLRPEQRRCLLRLARESSYGRLCIGEWCSSVS